MMLSKFTYPQKCALVLGGFAMFLLVAWKLAFSNTLALGAEIKKQEDKISWLKEKEKEIPFLKAKMDLIGKAGDNDSLPVRDRLTAYISDFAENNGCVVTEIPSFTAYKANGMQVQTNIFTIRGRFIPLLQLVQELEGRFRTSARLMSLRFNTVRDLQNKKKNLYLTLITQSFNQTGTRHE